MATRRGERKDMPDVPDHDFIDALAEIWSGVNYAAYHMAYVRVYSQTTALRTPVSELEKQEQISRNLVQTDMLICRAHLAAFFWQLDHVFEALRIAITRAQKEHPTSRYYYACERRLDEIEAAAIRQEISAYRNKGHEVPAIIGTNWDSDGRFLYHFLPTMNGHANKESIEMNAQLLEYFKFAAHLCRTFAPHVLKPEFFRSFRFPVTAPNSFLGELPPEAKGARQLEMVIEASDQT